ncbi:copper homeostasis CutC domain-containing protein [Multifurca ochricompacta]|uniref:Copper homeostasis protein cutC homolog n=1 Tax=Multifurca ochricompacta TaxID=376703 RepID=A0AAD4MDG0_9AGAM|nr:copper homeostasis CutC domain-containing protein [Multifurca ochricompacta]
MTPSGFGRVVVATANMRDHKVTCMMMVNKSESCVCVDSVQSALSAVHGGADRLEVCGNLGVGGGTTPSFGLVRAIQKAVPHVPIMAMVRPRTGDFLYSKEELDVMLEDIEIFKNAGIAGVVFGVLNLDGTADVLRTMTLVEAALPMQVCFHRALDMTRSAIEAFDQISMIPGITRVLTSGQSISVSAGIHVLQELFQRSQRRQGPAILPGGGINPETIEVHLSGGRWVDGGMVHRPESMGMGASVEGEWAVWLTNGSAIREVRSIIDGLASSS